VGDALGSVRQLADISGAVVLARAYDPYGVTIQTIALEGAQTSYSFTGEFEELDVNLLYLRARHYASSTGRFLTRDNWASDATQPMSYNPWNYGQADPVNYIDPTGHARCDSSISSRVALVMKYMTGKHTGQLIWDELNTYTAGGIGTQCDAPSQNNPLDPGNVGEGMAQISDNQVSQVYGEEVGNDRGYGLLCYIVYRTIGRVENVPCSLCKTPDEMKKEFGEDYRDRFKLEVVHDQNIPQWAVVYMSRRIGQVIKKCRQCTVTDRFIAAALGQNGPGLDPGDMWVLSSPGTKQNPNPFRPHSGDPINWEAYFKERISKDYLRGWWDTAHQLQIFSDVIWELEKYGWYVPSEISRGYIARLKNLR
jgi:RHS repeat-associated protein